MRIITVVVLGIAMVSLFAVVPSLRSVLDDLGEMRIGDVALAFACELASCASFVVVFRSFFDSVPAPAARELAWTEMGSGALLPGGGVGALAVGGWLLHSAGMSTDRIVRRSGGLFFLTSALNAVALIGGGVLLASGLSAGPHDALRAGAPIAVGTLAIAAAALLPRAVRGERRVARVVRPVAAGVSEALRAIRHPGWRLAGAIGYLGFDVAVLALTCRAAGYQPAIGALIVGYLIGYLANLVPVPGGIGVLEGGLVGTLVLYGAPATQTAAAVLVYHAIAFWVPALGGLGGYSLLHRRLARRRAAAAAPA